MTIAVTEDNFVRAETNRMLVGLQAQAGGVNRFKHHRGPASLDEQTVIRMNRDTLYSLAVVNISDGATVTVPDAGDRYLTVMVVNQDHYINRVFAEPGEYALAMEEFDTPYVLLAARVLVDATDPDDVAQVHAIQDGFSLSAAATSHWASRTTTRRRSPRSATAAWPKRRRGHGTHGMFGTKDEVDPHTHLLGTAGGLGRTARAGGVLREPRAGATRGPIHDHSQGRPRGRVLVHHRLRRGLIPPPERPGRLQRRQRLGDQEPGRLDPIPSAATTETPTPAPQKGWKYTVRCTGHDPDPRRRLDLPRP